MSRSVPPGTAAPDGSAAREVLHHCLFGWLNFVLVAPGIYLWLGLPLLMRAHGWPAASIGLFQLAGLPAAFKFVLALPVEHDGHGHARYRDWAVVLLLLQALALLAIAWRPLLSQPALLFGLSMAAALCATWADVPVNALAIRLLPPSQHLRAGGIRSMATCLGAIAGGGVMLLVQGRWGWAAPFVLLAGALALGAAGLLAAGRRGGPAAMPAIPRHGRRPRRLARQWLAYFRPTQIRRWAVLLALYLPFLGTAWFYLKPLLLDHGFAPDRAAAWAGVVGGLVGALASAAAARWTLAIGIPRALPCCAALACAVLVLLAALVWNRAPAAALVAGSLLLAAAMGASGSLVFGLMLRHARPGLAALDYGIQSSLFTLSRLAVPAAAGILVDRAGYGGTLCALSLAMLGVTALAWRWRHSMEGAGTPE